MACSLTSNGLHGRLFVGDFLYPAAAWDDPLSPPGGLYAMSNGSDTSVYHTALLKVRLPDIRVCASIVHLQIQPAVFQNRAIGAQVTTSSCCCLGGRIWHKHAGCRLGGLLRRSWMPHEGSCCLQMLGCSVSLFRTAQIFKRARELHKRPAD